MASHVVIGGRHDGASFLPGNGVAARVTVDQQLRDLAKERKEIEQGFAMIAKRRQKKHGIK